MTNPWRNDPTPIYDGVCEELEFIPLPDLHITVLRYHAFSPLHVMPIGVVGFEMTTRTMKIGDGKSSWGELAEASSIRVDHQLFVKKEPPVTRARDLW